MIQMDRILVTLDEHGPIIPRKILRYRIGNPINLSAPMTNMMT